jgi:hypothetical protein
MSRSLVRRLENLEEVAEQERASRVRVIWYWFNPKTGKRTYFLPEDDPDRGAAK